MKKILHIITHRDFLYGVLVLVYSIEIIQSLFELNWSKASLQVAILVWVVATWLIHAGYERKKDLIVQQRSLIDHLYDLLRMHKELKDILNKKIDLLENELEKVKKEKFIENKTKLPGN